MYPETYEMAKMRGEHLVAEATKRYQYAEFAADAELDGRVTARFRLMFRVRHYLYRVAPRWADKFFL